MSGWGSAVSTFSTAENSAPVAVMIAAPPERLPAYARAIQGDARFRLVATAVSPEDFAAKLALSPEALIVEPVLFPDPPAFARAMGAFAGAAWAVLPPGVPPEAVEAVRAVRGVRRVIVGEPDLPELLGEIAEQIASERSAARGSGVWGVPGAGMPVSGWRCIAVWSLKGGVGKSTIAAALAWEAAGRRIPTLLVGLGAPDPLPLVLGLRQAPNLLSWRARSGPDGLRAAVQKADVVDVLAGFPDPLSLGEYVPHALDGEASLPALAAQAARAGYGVVVLDVSSPELAPAALAAANALIYVAEPTLPGALAAVEGLRLLDIMGARFGIPREAVHLVVNRVRPSSLQPADFLRAVQDGGGGNVPLAAAIPDDPAVEEAINRRRPPYLHSEALRRGIRPLADALFGSGAAPAPRGKAPSQGGIRIRLFGGKP